MSTEAELPEGYYYPRPRATQYEMAKRALARKRQLVS